MIVLKKNFQVYTTSLYFLIHIYSRIALFTRRKKFNVEISIFWNGESKKFKTEHKIT
jgi:hypothetical protein